MYRLHLLFRSPQPLGLALRPLLFLLAAIAVLLSTTAHSSAADDAPQPILQFVQITDTHVGRTPQNAIRLEKIVGRIHQLPDAPSVVIHTGDIVHDGVSTPQTADALAILKKLRLPLLSVAGNHDILSSHVNADVAAWQKNFGPLSRSMIFAGVRFVLVCTEPLRSGSAIPGYDPLPWLAQELQQAAILHQPALVFLHVPPTDDFYHNAHHFDYPAEALAKLNAILQANPPLAVIAGHFHRDELHQTGKYPVFVCPPVDNRWGRQAAFRLYTVSVRADGTFFLSYTTQYDED